MSRALAASRDGTSGASRHRMPRVAVGLLLVLAASTPALAQPAPATDAATFDAEVAALVGQAGGLTAETAATRAAKTSPEVRRKLAEVAAATAATRQVELVRVPQVSAHARYTRLSDVDAPMLAPGFSFPVFLNSYTVGAQLALPLSDYLLTFPDLTAAARAGRDAARAAERSTAVDVAANARVAYYEWVRARLQVLVGQRLVAQINASLTQVRALAEVQRLSRADLLRVEAQRAQAELTLAQLENLAVLREEQLRILIGAKPEEVLTIGEDVRQDLAMPAAAKVDVLVDDAARTRLDVKVLDAGVEARERQRDAQKASRYPKLSAFAQLDYSNPNQRIIPSRDKFDLTWAAGVQLTWSLNDTLITGAKLDQSSAEISELREDKNRLMEGVRLQIVAATQAVTLAEKSLAVSAEGLVAAEEGYRVRRELLAAERATAVEIVDAETLLTQARFAAINARIDLRVALAQLQHASGQDVKQ
jgi:outer membrane protein